MSIIEQATKRLEQLERAGVTVPWSAARAARNIDTATSRASEGPLSPVIEIGSAAKTVMAPLPSPRVVPAVNPTAEPDQPIRRPDPSSSHAIDLQALKAQGYLVPDSVRSQIAKEFRLLKRTLLKNARSPAGGMDRRGALIMITSAVPGEGKTFCAVNLAMSMAMEVDTAVLLVDADVVRPNVLARLGISEELPGLLDLLTRDDLALHDVIVATNVAKLSIMSSGSRNERSTELLASNAMDQLLTKLIQEYPDHIVIFDAPPLLLTTESTVLASKVGQVVVVVEAFGTPRELVREAFEGLSNCPTVLSVLNKCEAPASERRYGYYYT